MKQLNEIFRERLCTQLWEEAAGNGERTGEFLLFRLCETFTHILKHKSFSSPLSSMIFVNQTKRILWILWIFKQEQFLSLFSPSATTTNTQRKVFPKIYYCRIFISFKFYSFQFIHQTTKMKYIKFMLDNIENSENATKNRLQTQIFFNVFKTFFKVVLKFPYL